MAELSNKKKHKVIAVISLISICVIAIIVAVALKATNKRQRYTEEEILDKCIEAINEGDGKWLTYCEICHSDEAIEFLEYYYEVCDEYGWEEVSGNECKNIVENGYKEEFGTLKELFGDEYKITYKIKSKEKVDRDSVDIEDVEYGGASNVTYDYIEGEYANNLKNRLKHLDVPEKTIEKCLDLYDKTLDINDEIKEVYKAEVEFTVSGTREITFTDEIWFGEVGGRLVPFEYIEMWESDSWFRHRVITPKYICEAAETMVEQEERLRLENEELLKETTLMLDNCFKGINEKDGNWLTYCQECQWMDAHYFVRQFYKLIDGRKRQEVADSKYFDPIDNGYEDEFAYLEKAFGEEYKITYNQKSEEIVDIEDMISSGDIYYKSAINTEVDQETCMNNISGYLSEYGVSDLEKIENIAPYKEVILGNVVLDEFGVDRVFKLELEITISGTKELTFEKEIWVVHKDRHEIPFEYKEGEEPSFEHIIIDPAYIVESVKESENGK